MRKYSIPLLWKIFGIHVFILLLGTLLLAAKNVWVHGQSWEDLSQYFVGAVAAFNLVILLLLQAVAYVRIHAVQSYFQGQTNRLPPDAVRARLLRLPSELFWSMIVLSVIMSIAFHTIGMRVRDTNWNWTEQLRSFFSEQALAVSLAVMVYSLLRTVFRPYLQRLGLTTIGPVRQTSVVKPLLLAFISCFIVLSFDVLRSVLYAAGRRDVDIGALTCIAVVDLLFSLSVFWLLIRNLRNELASMAEGIRSLSAGKRAELHRPISTEFPDEVGQLAAAFNLEQERIARRYDELAQELELAVSVQQLLLPRSESRFGSFHVRAEGFRRDVTGEWHDMVPIDQRRFAVAAGMVTGRDMPAALVMSAAMLLLRSEIRRGYSAPEALSRLRGELVEILPGEMQIYLGVALFDPDRQAFQAAAVGSVRFEIWRDAEGRLEELDILEHRPPVSIYPGDRLTIAIGTPVHPDARPAGQAEISVLYERG